VHLKRKIVALEFHWVMSAHDLYCQSIHNVCMCKMPAILPAASLEKKNTGCENSHNVVL